ncbi:MAG TPA: ATP-binding protein [Chryseolinea sp.]|nr:ATP-binding protein [Chryseolinea sp.]
MFNITLGRHLQSAIADLSKLIDKRLDDFFKPAELSGQSDVNIELPDLRYLSHQFTKDEYIVLLIALMPHIQPHLFDQIIQQKFPQGGEFSQLGGVRGKQFRGFLPTGETVLFLLAGDDLQKRFDISQLLDADHFLSKYHIIWLDDAPVSEPKMSGRLVISNEAIDFLIHGQLTKPRFGMQFPAQLIETQLNWDDLILNEHTSQQLKDLEHWIHFGQTLLNDWNMKGRIKPGYRVLFYGPPGTGKTLSATLLGKYTGKDVFKIDLSMIVSKFIGETEKNLSNLFARAENRDWILFFDEADALFGKRTNVRDAHDKYANQEVSYLLQRVETYAGMVILASNFRDNIDEAFVRRFQSIVYFPKPKGEERLKIWRSAFPANVTFTESVDLGAVADRYELTGANIVNIVQQVCLTALARGNNSVSEDDLKKAIQKEFAKEEKML